MKPARRTDCRLCGRQSLESVLALTPTPPANAFVTREQLQVEQPCYPLEVFFCAHCGHLQLCDVVDPGELFAHYVYVSGTSPLFVRHFQQYAETLISLRSLTPGDLVVEIGSNDGTMLQAFRQQGIRVLGVDPAIEISQRANAEGIPTVTGFFSSELAGQLRQQYGQASCMVANNVFAHIDDLGDVVEGIRILLAEDGLFAFEVSYFADVFRNTLFDTIYHEHLDYHTVEPLQAFFRQHGMELVSVSRQPTHGGSLRGIVKHADNQRHAVDASVQQLIQDEHDLGLHRPQTLRDFSRRIDETGAQLRQLLQSLKQENKRIAGFGAPAKATTLMYHFGLDRELIDYIVDDSPLKQGLFSPGKHIPIVDASVVAATPPDYLVILAWNFAPAIMQKMQAFHRQGGRFIVPLPTVEVH